MAPRPRANCQICDSVQSKYTCSACLILYCSVACFKQHKSSSCKEPNVSAPSSSGPTTVAPSFDDDTSSARHQVHTLPESAQDQPEPQGTFKPPALDLPLLDPPKPLRPLTSLNWPYIPEESYPNPLQRDDPKPLKMAQYEAIATSPSIRTALASHARLPDLLRALDQLKGAEREEELQRVLGVAMPVAGGSRDRAGRRVTTIDEEDMSALRALAEAVEAAVRGEQKDVLGLDWETT